MTLSQDQPSIFFRCDASPMIGAGHVMRCLTLADACRTHGWHCHFACTPETPDLIPALAESGHSILTDQDIQNSQGDLLIVDHYDLDYEYEHSMRQNFKHIMVIDDLPERSHDCDILLDQTYGRDPEDYLSRVPEKCKIVTGAEHALLRPQFANSRKKAIERRQKNHGDIKNILVAPGNANLDDVTQKIIGALSQYDGDSLQVHIVLGSKANNLQEVIALIEILNAKADHAYRLYTDVQDMAKMIIEADLAIGAAGTTSWERCCLGLPTLLIELAYNQKDIVTALAAQGAVINLGWHKDLQDKIILDTLFEIKSSPEKWQELSEQSFKICDGLGTERVMNVMETLW